MHFKMSNDETTLSSSSKTMSSGGRYPDQNKRGNKRQRDSQQSSSSESGTSASGDAAKDLSETKSGSRPGTPNMVGDNSPDGAVKACPETGGPGPCCQKRCENEADTSKRPTSPLKESRSPPRPLMLSEPCHVKPCGKEPCNCAKCRGRHIRRADIVRTHMARWPPKTRGGSLPKSVRKEDVDKIMEVLEKELATESSLSRGTSQGEREKKRAKRAGKEIAEDLKQSQSRDSKSKDTDSKSKDPKARGRSKSKDEPQSRDDSMSRDTTRDTRSMDTRSMDSGKSSASARSVETLDGQTELLESLVHAAHAEEKLHREKKELQKETKKLEKQNDKLAQELEAALKRVEHLEDKAKRLNKEKHDVQKHYRHEKSKFEKELQATLKNEQMSSAKEREKASQALQRFECSICFEELEGSFSNNKKGKKTNELKQRACFRPCNHAGACLECAIDVWEKTNKCPFCGTKLSRKPAPVHF